MVRLTGFGEIAGFPDGGIDVCRKVGPMVLDKYANYIFGKDAVSDIDSATLPCFRPMSPDDVPLVGSIRAVSGLFIHSGHGTLDLVGHYLWRQHTVLHKMYVTR